MPQTRNLDQGPVWRALSRVSLPMSLGILAVLSVGLVDAYFLARIGEAELAAVGFIYPVTTAITSLSIGLSAGANAALSQSIGRRDPPHRTQRTALHAVLIGLVASVAVALAFRLLSSPLFALLGARGDVAEAIADYAPWWALSFPFLVVMMIANAVFRSHGDGLTPSATMILAALANIALDPILIFGAGPIPALEAEGAGIATCAARMLAAAVALGLALHRCLLGTTRRPARHLRRSARDVLRVGAPAAFSNAINPAGMAAVTAAVATLGETAVAGFGAATRVQSLAIVPLLALSAGIGPVVGQNWGAERQDRARRAVWLSFGFCLAYGLGLALVLTGFGGAIARTIASGPDAAGIAAQYLRVVGWSLFDYGILVTANAAMNARSKALWSLSLSLGRILLVYIPGAWLGVTLAGFGGIVAAAVAANLLVVWGALVACRATGLVTLDMPLIRGPARAAGSRRARA